MCTVAVKSPIVDLHIYICLCHSSEGSLENVTFLVTTGKADVNSKDEDGETPLYKAAE